MERITFLVFSCREYSKFKVIASLQPLAPEALLPSKGTQDFPRSRPVWRGNGYHSGYKLPGDSPRTVEEKATAPAELTVLWQAECDGISQFVPVLDLAQCKGRERFILGWL